MTKWELRIYKLNGMIDVHMLDEKPIVGGTYGICFTEKGIETIFHTSRVERIEIREISDDLDSVEIRVFADEDDSLKENICISDEEITHLGLYTINDVKYWIVKK